MVISKLYVMINYRDILNYFNYVNYVWWYDFDRWVKKIKKKVEWITNITYYLSLLNLELTAITIALFPFVDNIWVTYYNTNLKYLNLLE